MRDLTAHPERETSQPRFPAHPVAGLAGTSFKPQHLQAILAGPKPRGFFEVHAENYMGAGGPPHRALEAIRRDHAVSLHGVCLSIGAPHPLDTGASCPFRRPCSSLRARARFRASRLVDPRDRLLQRPAAAALDRGDAGDGLRPYRRGAGGDRPADAARKSVDLCAVPRIDDARDGFPPRRRAAHRLRPAARRQQRLRVGDQSRLLAARLSGRFSAGRRRRDPSRRTCASRATTRASRC